MKKWLLYLFMLILIADVLTACGKTDYKQYISDERSDLFCAETEKYTVTIACIEREHPFLMDGIVSPRSKTVEVVLVEKESIGEEYEVYFLEDMPRGGEMSYRSVSGDYYYSRGVEEFPSGTVSLRIISGEETVEVAATSVKNENTLTTAEALNFAIAGESETISKMSEGGFCGEFHVRILRRDKTYYYVGIVDKQGGTISLLMDSETGAILARRERS